MLKSAALVGIIAFSLLAVNARADSVTKGYYPIDDTVISSYSAYQGNNYGTAETLVFQSSAASGTSYHMFKFNMTKIRADFLADWDSCNVTNAEASFYITNVYPASEGSLNWTTQHYTNQTWPETVPTWNNWDVEGNFINGTFVNQTIQGNTFVKSPSLDTRKTIQVTAGIAKDFNASTSNSSFILRGWPDNQGNNNETDVASSENSDSSKWPYINVTALCLDAPETTTTAETTTTTTAPVNYTCSLPTNVTGSCCLSADYLWTQSYYGANGTYNIRNETTFCADGCDTVLNTCSPPPSFVIVGAIIAVVAALWIMRWLRLF